MTEQPAITGLEVPAPSGPMAHIVADVEATIAALMSDQHLKPKDQALVGMVRLTARKLADISHRGQAYGVAMLLRELREGLSALPGPADSADDDERREFARLVEAVEAAEASS